jgi:hypothetical protein
MWGYPIYSVPIRGAKAVFAVPFIGPEREESGRETAAGVGSLMLTTEILL